MSDAMLARSFGSLFGLSGIALGAVSWANKWTLFLPFAVVLIGAGIGFQVLALSLRRSRA